MANATELLYHRDPLLLSFEDHVLSVDAGSGGADVVLARTAFYPEAGGQMADRGVLSWDGGRAEVLDVQADASGAVRHTLGACAEGPPRVGAAVRGEVDPARRRVHMALHTAQHMLSRALLDEAGAPTVSARLGETACTIDLDVAALDEAAAARAEALVNHVIDDDRPVRAYFPAPEELAALALRRAPKVSDHVRVVDIDGFDVSPCGGTHCTRTTQVALAKITGVERYKGKIRLSFVAGARGRAELARSHAALAGLARSLSCGASEVGVALEKLRAELSAGRESSRRLSVDLAARVARELAAEADARGAPMAIGSLPGASVELLRLVAGALAALRRGACVLSAPGEHATALVVSRHLEADVDCGVLVRRLAAACGGRGGGKAEHAEGNLPPGADVRAALDEVLRER